MEFFSTLSPKQTIISKVRLVFIFTKICTFSILKNYFHQLHIETIQNTQKTHLPQPRIEKSRDKYYTYLYWLIGHKLNRQWKRPRRHVKWFIFYCKLQFTSDFIHSNIKPIMPIFIYHNGVLCAIFVLQELVYVNR